MTTGYSSVPSIMMTLGSFQFGLSTAAYQELSRSQEWRWPAQDRFLQSPALQFVGPGGDTMTLPGVIYPEWRGGFGQLDAMRAVADIGEPQMLVDGLGNVLGQWVIERIEEKQSVFGAAGRARKIEFTVSLRKFDGQGTGTTITTVAATTAAAPSNASELSSALKDAASSVAAVGQTISKSIAGVTAVASELGGYYNSVIAPVTSAMRTANNLTNSLNDAKRLLGLKPSNISALKSATKASNAAASASANSSQFGAVLNKLSKQIASDETVPKNASAAVSNAVASTNKLTLAATSTQSTMSKSVTALSEQ